MPNITIHAPKFLSLKRHQKRSPIPLSPSDASLPFPISNSAIRNAFRSAVTGDLDSDLKNNASLDHNTIISLAKGYHIRK